MNFGVIKAADKFPHPHESKRVDQFIKAIDLLISAGADRSAENKKGQKALAKLADIDPEIIDRIAPKLREYLKD